MPNEVYVCRNRKANAFDAAEEFASRFGRKVGEWQPSRFQLEDGVKWYRVELRGEGWTIFEEE